MDPYSQESRFTSMDEESVNAALSIYEPANDNFFEQISRLSKPELTTLAQHSVTSLVENGDDLLALIAFTKKLLHFAEVVETTAKERGIAELVHYGKGGAHKLGVSLILSEVGVRHDYSADLVWQRLNQVSETAKKQLSEWESLLKTVPASGTLLTDDETGEIYRAHPPVRLGKESIKATIANNRS